MFMWVHIHVCMCGSQRLMLGAVLNFTIWGRVSHRIWNLLIYLDWLVSEHWDPPVSASPMMRVKSHTAALGFLCVFRGSELRYSWSGNSLYWLSYLPRKHSYPIILYSRYPNGGEVLCCGFKLYVPWDSAEVSFYVLSDVFGANISKSFSHLFF